MAILPKGTPFSCGMSGLCPGPPAEGLRGTRPCVEIPHVAPGPSGLRPIEKMSLSVASSRHDISTDLKNPSGLASPLLKYSATSSGRLLGLNPNPSPWNCKFDPEEKFPSSPARVKSKSSPLPQKHQLTSKVEKQPATPKVSQLASSRKEGNTKAVTPARQQHANKKREQPEQDQRGRKHAEAPEKKRRPDPSACSFCVDFLPSSEDVTQMC